MPKRYIPILVFSLLLLSSHAYQCYAQVTVSGPVCIVPGTEYQYNISGLGANDTNVSICLQGGVIAGTTNNCRNGLPVNMVRIVWKDTTTGLIQLVSQAGNSTLTVNITRPLQGGIVESSAAFKVVQPGTSPGAIPCSPASGGNCSAHYVYQWEQSTDNVHWTGITNNAAQHLAFSSGINQTTFYRRKVTETASGSIAYSNVVTIIARQ